jgi:ABC-type antimicrobial peptide transport system permease subunit
VIRSALFEALIYVATALLSALALTVVTVLTAAIALEIPPVFRLGEFLLVTLGALVLMIVATVAPTIGDLRRGVRTPLLAT